MKSKYFIFLIPSFFTLSCYDNDLFISEEPVTTKEQFPGVDKLLWSYFETFEAEATKRGLSVDLAAENILGVFADLSGTHVAGQCTHNYNQPQQITIDVPFWNSASELNREMIVFHELGHCYLDRNHLDASFSNGLCKSIMRSGLCCCQDAYTSNNRTYYLNELFRLKGSL